MHKKTSCLVVVILWVLNSAVSVRALDPSQPATSFVRTHFTSDEGLYGPVVNHIAQTQDGFLWLITNNLYLTRFDGQTFYRFELPEVTALAVAPDGDLWIGRRTDLKRIPSSSFNQFTLTESASYHPGPGKASEIVCLRFTRSGELWIGTADGLFRYEGDQFEAVGPRAPVREIEEAPDGHILVITDEGFIEFAGSEVVPHPQLAHQLAVKDHEIYKVLRDNHGNTWYFTAMGLARQSSGRIEKLGTYARISHASFAVYEDSHETIWIGKDEGLFRATSTGLELVVSGIQIKSLYEDRDGNLWVGTNGDGLYRLKDRAVRMFTTEDGLPNNVLMTVRITHDGAIWTGANCGGISRFDGAHFQTINEKNGLLNTCVWALAEDANRDLWIGTWGGGAFRYHNGSFTQYSKSQGMVDDRVTNIVAARDGSVWFGTRDGVTHLKNGQFRNFTTADGLSANLIVRVFEDRAGVIWIGTRQGLDRLVGDRFENFASVPKSLAIPLGEDRDGGFYILEYVEDTIRIDKGRTDTIKELENAYELLETGQGELWFSGLGIRRVPAGRLARSRKPDEPLDCEAFSSADGLATAQAAQGGYGMALGRDGKLWVATANGLAMFDLHRLPITSAKPSIYLTDVTIGRNTQRPGHDIVLPPGTNHLQIDFGAIEISSPEKIRMQYRLDGVDSEWLDAGPNPHAIYSNVPVGTHALHIRACNRNGIWDRQGVVFSVTQQPYFYQTRWFVAAMFALGVLLVAVIYRLRLRQISRAMSARFDERLAERTRLAREIHDTFVQTIQGSKMVADHALKDSADHARMVRAMEQLSAWLEQATEEGRAALNSLRASTTEKNDLAEAFRRAIDECSRESRAEISFSVNGRFREMHPVVRDEIYRIGYEALRNSCAHSGGDRVKLALGYAHDLTLSVNDNGVGIDSEVIEKGKEGHFGLGGMRERAERIGSKLTLVSSPGSGTLITLIVPGRIVFRSATPNWPERIRSLFGRN